jgi:hypothetical protein
MKRRWKLFLAGVAFLPLLVLFLPQGASDWEPPRVLRPLFDLLPQQTIYALCGRDIEFIFFVHDAATGEPIPGAEFAIWIADHRESDRSKSQIKLVTDETGRAKLLRKNADCEDVIRTFHKTVTLFNATWCEFDLRAEDYQPIEYGNMHYGSYPHSDRGYSGQEHLQRVEYKIPLVRKN